MKKRLDSLTALRGFAAISIVTYHAAVAYEAGTNVTSRTYMLQVAVSFFFVLSGFVLTWTWADSPRLRFWQNRAARILPLYIVAWLLTLAGRSFVHWEPSNVELGATLALVQAWLPNDSLAMAVNPPAWSLSCEALFYLSLPFIAPRVLGFSNRALRNAGVLACGWLLVGAALARPLAAEHWAFFHAAEFVAGVVLAAWIRRGWTPRRRTTAVASSAAAITLVFIALGIQPPVSWADALALPAFLGLIAIMAVRDINGRATWLHSPIPQALGRWSYAIYITHWILLVLPSRYLVGGRWIAAGVLSCVATGALLNAIIERPAERLLRGLGDSGAPSTTTPQLADVVTVPDAQRA